MPLNRGKLVGAVTSRKFLRRFLVALIAVLCLWFVFAFVGQGLREIAIGQMAELTNTKIKARSIKFNLNGSVSIKGLEIKPYKSHDYDDAILKAENVYARFGIGSLLLLRPRLKKITVKDFVFDAQQDLDTGEWNLAAITIRPPKGGSGKIPVIQLKRGLLRYSKVTKGHAEITASVPLDAKLEPSKKIKGGHSFRIKTANRDEFRRSTLTGHWKRGVITVAGGISSEHIPAFEKAWIIENLAAQLTYKPDGHYQLIMRMKDLVSKQTSVKKKINIDKPAFLERLGPFAALQKFFHQYHPWGRVDINFEASGNLARLENSTVTGNLYCKDVSICSRKFIYPVEHVVGQIDFTEKDLTLDGLHGQHGDVTVSFDGWSKNFGEDREYEIVIASQRIPFDRDMYAALNPKQKKFWDLFSPTGAATMNLRLACKPRAHKTSTLVVELLSAEAAYHKFPYSLRNITGKVIFDDTSLRFSNLVSKVNDREVIFTGQVTGTNTDRPIYDISIEANNVALDSEFVAALPAKHQDLFSQFCTGGIADTKVKIFTPEADSRIASYTADIRFRDTSLKINHSPLTLTNAFGIAVLTPDLLHIEDMEGLYEGGIVQLTGKFWPGHDQQSPRYSVSLSGQDVELNDSFFNLLPPSAKDFIRELKPTGKIDYVAVLEKDDDIESDYEITIDCLGNSIDSDYLPYPLNQIRGSLTITKKGDMLGIELDEIRATCADNVQMTPQSATINITGDIEIANNTFTSAQLSLSAKDFFFDQRVSVALPKEIRDHYLQLSPTGRVDLDFEDIEITNANGKKSLDFAGVIVLKSCNLGALKGLGELSVTLNTKGSYKTDVGFFDAQAAIVAGNVKVNGKSLTNLNAKITYDPHEQNWIVENLTADFYGGRLTGKCEIKQTADNGLEYLLRAGFEGVDLSKFHSDKGSEHAYENNNTSGSMAGSFCVTSRFGNNDSRHGRCRLLVTDMQIGKQSPLRKLMDVLSLTEPKNFTFDQMLVDSYIHGEQLLIERFDLSGDNVAFHGSGRLDLPTQDIDLTLTARGSRLATEEPSILQSLADALGQGIVRINVTGNLYDPQVSKTTLPVITDTLGLSPPKPYAPTNGLSGPNGHIKAKR